VAKIIGRWKEGPQYSTSSANFRKPETKRKGTVHKTDLNSEE
jgi:hypothetical protein